MKDLEQEVKDNLNKSCDTCLHENGDDDDPNSPCDSCDILSFNWKENQTT